MMVRAESYTPVVIDKVRLLFEAARIYDEQLRQETREAALRRGDRARSRARRGRPPARRAVLRAQQWRELSPVIDMLCRKVGQLHADPRELNELYYRARARADELGDYQKALGYYKAAYDIDSTYLPTLIGRADLLFKMADYDNAGKIYQTILVQHRDGQDEADVVRIYNRLGMVRQASVSARRRSTCSRRRSRSIRRTATRCSGHRSAAAAGRLGGGRPRQARPDRDVADKEKTQLLDEIAGIYHDKLQNPQKATGAYLEALEVAPEDHQLLQKLLDIYTETKQWKKAVETIERFIALEADTCGAGAYYHAAATVCRDELKSLDDAVDYYNKALDSFFANPESCPRR
jgi:tetratricopeptide (TPR) repeat protein